VHHRRDFYFDGRPNSGGTTDYAFVPFYGRTRFLFTVRALVLRTPTGQAPCGRHAEGDSRGKIAMEIRNLCFLKSKPAARPEQVSGVDRIAFHPP